MPQYLLQGSYTADSWAAQVKDPKNRIEVVRPAFEALGGTIDHAWMTFGEYDVAVVSTFPDNVHAAAISVAISVGGAFKAAKTTPLLSLEEGVEAMTKAGQAGYRPPGS